MRGDRSARARQHQELERRKQGRRARCDRILIVSEGTRTEPLYFEDIRIALRLPTANIAVVPSAMGTEPIQVVKYARSLFEDGDLRKGIEPRAFERVYAVFDRHDHRTYFDALRLAESLAGKLKNDEKNAVVFQAIASVPSFELWLLLYYEDVQAPMHRDEVVRRLKRHIPGYEKGAGKTFALTRERLAQASQRSEILAARFTAYSDPEPYTGVAELVKQLMGLGGDRA